MTLNEKRRLHRKFLRKLGPNAEALVALFENAANEGFYLKDAEGRIMAINRFNRDACNVKDEWDAIGLKSSDLFPATYARHYIEIDRQVRESGQPLVNDESSYPADRSMRKTVSTIYPLRDADGHVIGTARAYHFVGEDERSARYGRIRSVVTHIERNFGKDLRLDDLIAMSGMSATMFKATFAKTFGMSPGRYITTIRLNAARERLEKTNLPLSEIAAETGFFDQSHFSRTFKQIRGITPGDYRRQHQSTSKGDATVSSLQ